VQTWVIRLLKLLAFNSMLIASGAGAEEIACPARIDLDPVALRAVPDGWTASQRLTSLAVDGAFVTVGPPADRMDLKPESKTTGGQQVSVWRFDEAEKRKGLWLSCSYGKWLVLLSTKLTPGISQCHGVAPTVDTNGSPVMRFDCE
jgi:hypothetical protein